MFGGTSSQIFEPYKYIINLLIEEYKIGDYAGMTTNERLFVSGKLAEYDKAIAEKDEDQVREILKSLNVDEPSVNAIVKQPLNESNS